MYLEIQLKRIVQGIHSGLWKPGDGGAVLVHWRRSTGLFSHRNFSGLAGDSNGTGNLCFGGLAYAASCQVDLARSCSGSITSAACKINRFLPQPYKLTNSR